MNKTKRCILNILTSVDGTENTSNRKYNGFHLLLYITALYKK